MANPFIDLSNINNKPSPTRTENRTIGSFEPVVSPFPEFKTPSRSKEEHPFIRLPPPYQPTTSPFALEAKENPFIQPLTTGITPQDTADTALQKLTTEEKQNEELKELSEDQLLKDSDWLDNARAVYEYEEDEPWTGNRKGLGKWFLNRHSKLTHNLTNAMFTAGRASDFPTHVKQAWLESSQQYHDSDPTGRSFGKALQYGLLDWVNLPMVIAPFAAARITTFGLAKTAARYNFQKALRKNIRQEGLKKLTKADKKRLIKQTRKQHGRRGALEVAMPFGMVWGGAFNLADQELRSEIDPEYEGFSNWQFAGAVGAGAAAGYGLGLLLPKAGHLIGDSIGSAKARFIKDKVSKDVVQQAVKEEATTNPAVKTITPKQEEILASDQGADNTASLNVLEKLFKGRFGFGSGIVAKPKEEQLRFKKWFKGILYGAGRHEKGGIKEKLVANKKLGDDIDWQAHDLPINRMGKEDKFIDPKNLSKGDQEYVVSQNVLGSLNRTQAVAAIKEMVDTVKDTGTMLINGGKVATKKAEKELESIVDASADITKKTTTKDGIDYKVTYKPILDDAGNETGQYREILEEVIGADDLFIWRELKRNFHDVTTVKDGNELVFIARNKIKNIPDEGPPIRRGRGLYPPSPKPFNFKHLFSLKSLPLVFQQGLISRGILPEDVFGANIRRKAVQDATMGEAKILLNQLNDALQGTKTPFFKFGTRKSIPLKGWLNHEGKKYEDWSPEERIYADALMDEILKGNAKFFRYTENRVGYVEQQYRHSAPEILRYLKNNNGKDLLGDIPDDVMKVLDDMIAFKRKAQEEGLASGMLGEPGMKLHTKFISSMGLDENLFKETGKIVYKDPYGADIIRPGDVDLHFNLQYKSFEEGPEWFNKLANEYPERVKNFKELILTEIQANRRNFIGLLDITNKHIGDDYNKLLNKRAKLEKIQRNLDKKIVRIDPKTGEVKAVSQTELTPKQKRDLKQTKEQIKEIEIEGVNKIYDDFVNKYSDREGEAVARLQGMLGPEGSLPLALQQVTPGISQEVKGIFKERKDILPVIKSFLGEYQDPGMNFVNTVYKLKQNIENFRYETSVRKAFDEGRFPKVQLENKSVWDPVLKQWDFPSNKMVSLMRAGRLPSGLQQPFRGKYDPILDRVVDIEVPEIVVNAIRQGNEVMQPTMGFTKKWMGYQALTRMSVTALNPAGYPRNYLGAAIKAAASGNWNGSFAKEAHTVIKGMNSFTDQQLNDNMLLWRTGGLIGTGSRAAELRGQIRDVGVDIDSLTNVVKLVGNANKIKLSDLLTKEGLLKAPKKFKKLLENESDRVLRYYQSMDDIWKVFSFLNEQKRYRPILEENPNILGWRTNKGGARVPIKPDDVLKWIDTADGRKIPYTYLQEYAAQMVRRHMDNYGEVARLFKWLRRMPIADFVGFNTEQVRTSRGIVNTAMDDIRAGMKLKKETNNKRGNIQYLEGWKRLGSFIGVVTSGTGAAGAMSYGYWNTLSKEEQEKGKYLRVDGKTRLNPYWSSTGQGGLSQVGMPDYAQGNELIQIGPRQENGDVWTLNWSRYNPLTVYTTPVREAIQDLSEGNLTFEERIGNASGAGLKGILNVFGTTMASNALYGAWMGVDDYGRPLVDVNDKKTAKDFGARALRLISSVVPGFIKAPIKQVDIWKQAKLSEEGIALTPGGFEKRRGAELANSLGGAFQELSPQKSFTYTVAPILKQVKAANTGYIDIFKGFKNPTAQEIETAYIEALQEEKQYLNDLREIAMAGYATGLSKTDMMNALTASNIYPERLPTFLRDALSLTAFYNPSIKPRSESIRKKLEDHVRRAKLKPGSIHFNKDILNRLREIEASFARSRYSFVSKLDKPEEEN